MSDQPQNFNEDTRRCPLCGGDNHCAIAAGRPAEDCWCQAAKFSEAALTEAAQYPQHCICPGCAGNPEKD